MSLSASCSIGASLISRYFGTGVIARAMHVFAKITPGQLLIGGTTRFLDSIVACDGRRDDVGLRRRDLYRLRRQKHHLI